MNNADPTSSFLARCIVSLLDVSLLVLLVAWVAVNNVLQICYILAVFAIALALVLSVAVWRHGFRWFFSRRALRFYAWLLVGVISVIVLFYAEEGWRGKRAWAALQREAAARGESLELSSVFPPPVPDDQNFALAPDVGRLLGCSTTDRVTSGPQPPGYSSKPPTWRPGKRSFAGIQSPPQHRPTTT